jgi:hypothetical protein
MTNMKMSISRKRRKNAKAKYEIRKSRAKRVKIIFVASTSQCSYFPPWISRVWTAASVVPGLTSGQSSDNVRKVDLYSNPCL